MKKPKYSVLELRLRIRYELGSETTESMAQHLNGMVDTITNRGMMTGETDASVDCFVHQVVDFKEKTVLAGCENMKVG